jgi:hypothetical protein
MVRRMSDAPPIAAGFFVTKATARDAERSPDLLPPVLTSLSPCIAPSAQVAWGWDVPDDEPDAVAFGIAPERLPELQPWEASHGVSFPNVFHSLEDARGFVATVLPDSTDVVIVGAALPAELVEEFLVDQAQTTFDATTGAERESCFGVNLVLSARCPLPPGGETLGFELVLYGYNLECSWLCTGTERAVATALGVRPNGHGLVGSQADAMRVHAWMARHPEQSEPGPYYPWLLVRYGR